MTDNEIVSPGVALCPACQYDGEISSFAIIAAPGMFTPSLIEPTADVRDSAVLPVVGGGVRHMYVRIWRDPGTIRTMGGW